MTLVRGYMGKFIIYLLPASSCYWQVQVRYIFTKTKQEKSRCGEDRGKPNGGQDSQHP